MTQPGISFRKIRFVLWAILMVVGLGLLGYQFWVLSQPAPTVVSAKEAMRASITGKFSLVDHHGKPVTEADYRGKWQLVFFGYTHCPDVCPTTLTVVAELMDRLGDQAKAIQPLFVSVDPERDTPATLAEYVDAFHPSIIGLSGTPEQVKDAARSFKVFYAKVGDTEDYSMDHSAYLYVMNRQGQIETVFSYQDEGEKLYQGMVKLLKSDKES